MFVREMAESERPKQKAISYGVGILSNAELLSVIIKDQKNASGIDIAYNLIASCGDIAALNDLGAEELKKIDGIGDSSAVEILAAIELGKRISRYKSMKKIKIITCPEDVYDYASPIIEGKDKEHFAVILMNIKNHILSMPIISIGGLAASVVDAREVFKEAVKNNAASIIMVHNHPSGDPTPSKEDILITRRMIEAGKIMDIPVLDHVIIGNNRYTSLKETGHIKGDNTTW